MWLILERHAEAYVARWNPAIFHSWQYGTFLPQGEWLNQKYPYVCQPAFGFVDFMSHKFITPAVSWVILWLVLTGTHQFKQSCSGRNFQWLLPRAAENFIAKLNFQILQQRNVHWFTCGNMRRRYMLQIEVFCTSKVGYTKLSSGPTLAHGPLFGHPCSTL